MIPVFPEFKKIEISDRSEIEKFTREFPPYSDFNFTALFCWDIHNRRSISFLNDNLVAKLTDDVSGEDVYSFVGKNKITGTIDTLLKLSKAEGLKQVLRFIPQEVADICSVNECPYVIKEDRNNFDYIYSIKNLSTYPGHAYAQARNLLSRFETRHGASSKIEAVDLKNDKERKYFLDLLHRWEGVQEKYVENEEIAIKRMLDNIIHFDLVTIMVFVNNIPVAVSISEKINDTYAISHFAKADYRYAGVYSRLMQATADHFAKLGCIFLNYEEDLGFPSLRQAKESYQPTSFLKKYTIEPKATFPLIKKMLPFLRNE